MADFLQHFPSELRRRTASFLSLRDALNLSETCKSLHKSLSIRRLRPDRLLFAQQIFDDAKGDRPVPWLRVPVLNRRVHSLAVRLFWRDQGWGNRKGKLYVVETRSPPSYHPVTAATAASRTPNSFGGGRVLYESSTAPHHEEALEIRLTPPAVSEDDDLKGSIVYHLWYKVGGGGGHRLVVRQATVRTLIFDDEGSNLSRNYQHLSSHGVLHHATLSPNVTANNYNNSHAQTTGLASFSSQLLLRVSRSLRRQLANGLEPDEDLAAFLRETGIPVHDASLLALEEIVQADVQEQTTSVVTPPAAAQPPVVHPPRRPRAQGPPNFFNDMWQHDLQIRQGLPGGNGLPPGVFGRNDLGPGPPAQQELFNDMLQHDLEIERAAFGVDMRQVYVRHLRDWGHAPRGGGMGAVVFAGDDAESDSDDDDDDGGRMSL